MVEQRVTVRRGVVALVAGLVVFAFVAASPGRRAVAGPAAPTVRQFVLVASGYCSFGSGGSVAVSVRSTGTAPERAEVGSTVTVTIASARATFGPGVDIRPVSLRYGAANPIRTREETTDFRFADGAPQGFSVGAGVYSPLAFGGRVGLVASVAEAGSPSRATVSCELTSSAPVEVPLDLPSDGSRQWFRFSGTCNHGLQGQTRVDVGGIAPTRVAPGERPRLVTDGDGFSAMASSNTVVLGVSGSPDGDTYELPGFGGLGAEQILPPAGPGGTMTVSLQQIRGLGFYTGPDGWPVDFPFACGFTPPSGGAPVVIAVAEPGTTTSTSTTTTTTTTTPPCRLAAVLPRWLWDLLVRLFRLGCG